MGGKQWRRKLKSPPYHSALKMFASYSSSVEGETQAWGLLDRLLLSVAFLRTKSACLILSTPELYSRLGTPSRLLLWCWVLKFPLLVFVLR